MFLREEWLDPRLAFDETEYDNVKTVHMQDSVVGMIWTPDTYIRNAIDSTNTEAAKAISHQTYTRISNNGRILQSRRYPSIPALFTYIISSFNKDYFFQKSPHPK